jgi:hypothetical protein
MEGIMPMPTDAHHLGVMKRSQEVVGMKLGREWNIFPPHVPLLSTSECTKPPATDTATDWRALCE